VMLLEKIITENLSVRDAEKFTKESGVNKQTPATSPKRENPVPQASVLEAQHQLSNHLNTTVSVHLGRKRGKITIDFATVSDLQRIYDIICQQN